MSFNNRFLERIKIYREAAERWGVRSQMIVALEELAELSVEVAKHLNGKRSSLKELIDELADAKITIEQIEYNLSLETQVEVRMEQKIKKLQFHLSGSHPQDEFKGD